jgi:molecular chaperone GrpE
MSATEEENLDSKEQDITPIIDDNDEESSTSTTEDESEKIIMELRGEAKENYDKYLRAVAELENFKKRFAKERSEILKYAGENLARDLLDVIDNLERAIKNSDQDKESQLYIGVKLILDSFTGILERHSIKSESALGAMFDPSKQEALASVPTAEKEPGTVLDEYRKAYFFKDKVLRHAQVVVAALAPAENND